MVKSWSKRLIAILAQDGKELGVHQKPRAKFWGNIWVDGHFYSFYTDFLGDGT